MELNEHLHPHPRRLPARCRLRRPGLSAASDPADRRLEPGRGALALRRRAQWTARRACCTGSWWSAARSRPGGGAVGSRSVHPWLALAWDLFIAYSLLCMRDLLVHGQRVLDALDDLPTARRRLGMLVGRDTEPLQRDGIVRATIESLSENLTDGVLTPLWALCLFGLPGLILVKAVSTPGFDGRLPERALCPLRLGRGALRRSGALAAGAALGPLDRAGGGPAQSASRARRSAPPGAITPCSPSPNSGWSEAACAGALRVRLVGPIPMAGSWSPSLHGRPGLARRSGRRASAPGSEADPGLLSVGAVSGSRGCPLDHRLPVVLEVKVPGVSKAVDTEKSFL